MDLSVAFYNDEGKDGPFYLAQNWLWDEVRAFCGALPADAFPLLTALVMQGELDGTRYLSEELDFALENEGPNADVRVVLKELAEVAGVGDDTEIAKIVTADNDDEEDEPERYAKKPDHAPAGSPEGGQFVSQGGGGSAKGKPGRKPKEKPLHHKTLAEHMAELKDAHKSAVKAALEAGEDVPADVLAEYPDLNPGGRPEAKQGPQPAERPKPPSEPPASERKPGSGPTPLPMPEAYADTPKEDIHAAVRAAFQADQAFGGYNFAALDKVRELLPKDWSRKRQDHALMAAARDRLISIGRLEGRHGIDTAQQDASIELPHGDGRLGQLSLHDAGKELGKQLNG
jgi:hypothetical protein